VGGGAEALLPLALADRLLALGEDEVPDPLEALALLARAGRSVDLFFERWTPAGGDHGVEHDAAQCAAVAHAVGELAARAGRIFAENVAPGLAELGMPLLGWDDLGAEQRRPLLRLLDRRIVPILTPLAVDAGRPFPLIASRALNLVLALDDPSCGSRALAVVRIPAQVPRLLQGSGGGLVPCEQLIGRHLDALFPGAMVAACEPFRVTRSIHPAASAGRRGVARAVRLEVQASMPGHLRTFLKRRLGLDRTAVHALETPLDVGALADAVYPPARRHAAGTQPARPL
jgi:polyphosphate kinase